MKKLCLIIICSLTLFGLKAQKNEIFNGKNLRGWKIHGTEKWYVQKGQLVCESGTEGKYGYLSTEKLYNDFILYLEFKQESDGNSGVFFRSTIEGIKICGWQVEVAPPKKNTGGIYESYGRGWLIKPNPSKDRVLRMGKWNQLKIMVIGSLVTTRLNGIKMVELEDEKIGKGKGSIALQIHNGGGIKVRWKNIRIEEL